MDVISAVGLVQSSFGLALQFGKVAKTLNDVADKYKNAALAIKSLAQNLDILELAWTQIGEWCQGKSDHGLHDDSLTKRVQAFLETGLLVIEALQHDLQSYNIDDIGFSQRTRFIWNETSLQAHGSRIRDQALSMSLFLQVVNLPTPQARAKLLHKSESQFQKSDESAYSIDSIVPSRMSASTGRTDSYVSDQDAEIVQFRRLSFEKGLFMSKVYMRSCKNVMAKEILKARLGSKQKAGVLIADQTAKNWEAIRDQIEADSLLANSCEESTDDTDTIRSYVRSGSKHRSFEEVVRNNQIEGDSMLARSRERSISNADTIRSHIRSQSRDRVSEGFVAPSVSGWGFDNELIRSCEQGDSLQAQWLAVRGVDLHAQFKQGSYSGLTAIHVAAIHGHIDVVKVLLSCGANIEGETASERRRPLHLAALNGQFSMVRFLIREGAQLVSVFEIAREAGFKSLEILLSCSDPAYQNIDGKTLLHTLAQSRWRSFPPSSNVLQMCQLLLNRGVDVHHKDKEGNEVLHCLASNKSGNVATTQGFAKLLLDRGAAVNPINQQGYSPLFLAIYYRNRQLSRLLLECGSYILTTWNGFLAEVQTYWIPNSPTPSYIFRSRRSDTNPENLKEEMVARSFELSLDDHGYLSESAMNQVRVLLHRHPN